MIGEHGRTSHDARRGRSHGAGDRLMRGCEGLAWESCRASPTPSLHTIIQINVYIYVYTEINAEDPGENRASVTEPRD
jgi:hypothetical protein